MLNSDLNQILQQFKADKNKFQATINHRIDWPNLPQHATDCLVPHEKIVIAFACNMRHKKECRVLTIQQIVFFLTKKGLTINQSIHSINSLSLFIIFFLFYGLFFLQKESKITNCCFTCTLQAGYKCVSRLLLTRISNVLIIVWIETIK